MKLSTKIDKLLRLAEQLDEANFILKKTDEYKQVEKLDKKIGDLKLELIDENSIETLKSEKGKLGSLTVSERVSFKIVDWESFRDYVVENDAYDLFQRSTTPTAVIARLDDGEKVPGLMRYTSVSVKPKFFT